MKASIADPGVFDALRPLEIAAYLRAAGWTKTPSPEGRWSTWTLNEYEIGLPLSKDLKDFRVRMAQAISTLAISEDRSELEILADLTSAAADIVRLKIADQDSVDGTISIALGARLVQSARDLMMAGACAAIERRAVFQTRKPNQAMEYLNKVRMGQTERGSFVLTILSRVAPVLEVGEHGTLWELDQPFERKVTSVLARALDATSRAANSAVASGSFEEFRAAVGQGVSANLCDALSGLTAGEESRKNLEVSFSWSRSRPNESAATPNIITFPSDRMSIVEEAARLFRETAEREEFDIRGPVFRLQRAEGDPTGKVTVHSFIDGEPRKITLVLGEPDYHIAIRAHEQGLVVECVGDLIREGRGYALRNPHHFKIEEQE